MVTAGPPVTISESGPPGLVNGLVGDRPSPRAGAR